MKKFDGGDFLILLLYSDNMLIVRWDPKKIRSLKKALSKSFAMKHIGPTNQILGMHTVRDQTKKLLQLSLEKYVTKVLERFTMSDAKPFSLTLTTNLKLSGKQSLKTKADKVDMRKIPYASALKSLMYAMVCTRPDIGCIVGVVSRFMINPEREHWVVVKWIL